MTYNKPIHMTMYAEVYIDGMWKRVHKAFKSSFKEMNECLTDRVCDENNPVLFEVFSGMHPEKYYDYTNINAIRYINGSTEAQYVTLGEILKYNWDQPISKIGIITEWQYKRLKKKGIWPASMNRIAFDEGAKIVSSFEMDMILGNDALRDDNKYYVQIEYDAEPLRNKCKFFCENSIPSLMQLVPPRRTYDSVRVVYNLTN